MNDNSSEVSDTAVGPDPAESSSRRQTARNILGAGLIVVGAILLLQNLELFGSVRWDIVWPVALVVLGVAILLPSIRR